MTKSHWGRKELISGYSLQFITKGLQGRNLMAGTEVEIMEELTGLLSRLAQLASSAPWCSDTVSD